MCLVVPVQVAVLFFITYSTCSLPAAAGGPLFRYKLCLFDDIELTIYYDGGPSRHQLVLLLKLLTQLPQSSVLVKI